jgi:hypothetical protein
MIASHPNLMRRYQDYQPSKTMLLWSCAACVVATLIVGFSWGGWVTGGTAREMATKAGQEANASMAAGFCVTQFKNDSNTVSQLAALNKTDTWDRGDFITKGGWAKLPGMKEPVPGSADLCAKALTEAPLPVAKTSG